MLRSLVGSEMCIRDSYPTPNTASNLLGAVVCCTCNAAAGSWRKICARKVLTYSRFKQEAVIGCSAETVPHRSVDTADLCSCPVSREGSAKPLSTSAVSRIDFNACHQPMDQCYSIQGLYRLSVSTSCFRAPVARIEQTISHYAGCSCPQCAAG